MIKRKPRRELKFHHEMFDGAGRSMNEWLMTESIYILSLLISLGCLGTYLKTSIYDGLCLIVGVQVV